MLSYHRDLADIYMKYPMLRTASLARLACSNNALLCYGRFNDEEQIIVLINNSESEVNSKVSLWQLGITGHECFNRLICSYEIGYHRHPATYKAKDGVIDVTITAHSSVMLYHGPKQIQEEKDDKTSKRNSGIAG